MTPRGNVPLALTVILSLSGPLLSANEPAPSGNAAVDKDLCSYLKDVESKTEAECRPEALEAFKAKDPAAFAQKQQLVPKRKSDVLAAYETLKSQAAAKSAGADRPNPAINNHADPLRIQPPINERTFSAWLGDKALDLKPVYAGLLEAQNKQLEKQRAAEVSPERKKELEQAIKANQGRIAGLQKIKDPAQLSCFLGDTCGHRADAAGPAGPAVDGGRGASAPFNFEKANAEANRQAAIPGGKVGGDVPGLTKSADPKNREPSPKNGSSPLLPISLPLGLGLVGYGIYSGRKDDDRPRGALPPDAVHKPGFLTDPLGTISDYAFGANIALQEHPYLALGTIGVVAVGGLYFGAPLLLGGGGGTAAGMTPLAATAGAAPTAGAATMELGGAGAIEGTAILEGAKTLAKIGTTIVAAKAASDHIRLAQQDNAQSGGGHDKKESGIFHNVEVVDKSGNPIGEIDEVNVNEGKFVENKSAKGIGTPEPRTGKPNQTASEWAQKQTRVPPASATLIA